MIDTLRKDFFMDNIFLKNQASETLDSFLSYSEGGRDNLGNTIPVMVYRMLEYSLKLELVNRLGKEEQVEIFRSAGRMAGEYFAKHFLNLNQPLDTFVSHLQSTLEQFKIGILRIESIDEKSGKIILTISEDADCSGLPVLTETVCNYDEGFISDILSLYSNKHYEAVEVDCWATGDRVCRFHVDIKE